MEKSIRGPQAPLSPEVAQEGELWSARARDWAEVQERFMDPCYLRVLERAGLRADQSILDVGCGAGRFLQLAAERGARVTGLDASAGMLEIAKSRCPEGDFHLGDMEHLPFRDGSFDLVSGFNSFSHADDPVRALMEASRVTKPLGQVVVTVWGPAEPGSIREVVSGVIHSVMSDEEHSVSGGNSVQHQLKMSGSLKSGRSRRAEISGSSDVAASSDLAASSELAAPDNPANRHQSTAPDDSIGFGHFRGQRAFTESGEPAEHEAHIHSITAADDLGDLVKEAGLTPVEEGEVICEFSYPDRETLLRGLMSPGPFVEATRKVGEAELKHILLKAVQKFKTEGNTFSFSNRFRYLIASVPRI